MTAPDRLQELLNQNSVTGIDFVYVHEDQKTLDVFFFQHDNPPQAEDIVGTVALDQICIYSPEGGESLPEVPVKSPPVPTWVVVDNRSVLRLQTAMPGDFSLYRMSIDHPKVDRYFNDVTFSFKAHCPSDLDCESKEPACPPEDMVDFPVDYSARDFWSYRRALLDFANLRYPDWKDRLEADIGVMLVEVMSALGDELAYYQDRIAREAYLETATQRRSLRRHARMVDYEMHNGLSAATWLDVTVKAGQSDDLPAGSDVWALSDNGKRISYEVGRGLADAVNDVPFNVAAARNALTPHIWDEDDICLHIGATELFIKGHQKTNLNPDDPPEDPDGKWVLLKTEPVNPADPERRWLVRIIEVEDTRDSVFNEDVTRIEWEKAQALPFELNMTELEVRCNIVPATAGRTVVNRITIGVDPSSLTLPGLVKRSLRQAVEREGVNMPVKTTLNHTANGTSQKERVEDKEDKSVAYLFSLINPELKAEDKGKEEATAFLADLEKPEGKNLTWLGKTPQTARPEIRLAEVEFDGANWIEQEADWEWRRSLLGVSSSQPSNRHFTLEDGTWDRVVGYWRSGQEAVHVDYASNEGFTVRFGDDEFGMIPADGTVFQATYRLGNGRRTNVPADAITEFDESLSFIESVTNPLAADSGRDPEAPTEVRQLAPEAFRHLTYRAVRSEDYAEAAERLTWVQRAGAKFRWTGSWLTLFATPDPLGAATVSDDQHQKLTEQLDRFRQAGREAYSADPRYADLDLKIKICVEPFAYQGEVKEAVLTVLLGEKGVSAQPGFFSANSFTFGTPLIRSALEGVVQAVPGVKAVESISIKRRGWFDWRNLSELTFEVGMDEVIRVENDPLFPARGSVRLYMEGGA